MSNEISRIPDGDADLAPTPCDLMYPCPVCQNGYQPETLSFCPVCGWDLTACPPAFIERQSQQVAWAKKMWQKLQLLEKTQAQVTQNTASTDQGFIRISSPPNQQIQSVNLSEMNSERGINYTSLARLLEARQWREADEETTRLMLLAAHREQEGYLDVYSIRDFPCIDLSTINQLWLEYSRGHFGFSVQKRIWESINKQQDLASETNFGDCLGWRKDGDWLDYDDLVFDLRSPQGHLPVGFAWWVVWWCISLSRVVVFEVFERLDTCQL